MAEFRINRWRVDVDKLKYAVGSSLFLVGAFVSIIIILELSILQIPFSIDGYRVHAIGFPWLTEQVANSTGLWRMPDYTQQFPNVYFLNYGEALFIALAFTVYGRALRNSFNVINRNARDTISRIGFISTILSMAGLLYYWVRMTVLFNTYVLGNSVYYPASTPAPGVGWLKQFNLPLTMNIKPYSGALVYHIYTSTISIGAGLRIDMGLYIVAFIFFISIIIWKYFI
ncbi:MAG: hypothetical protein QW597_00465 [Thermoplasmataceae archaeon]